MTERSAQHDATTIKDTLASIIIAFVLAFVFRAFVIEAFVIPTGSMAPTLYGQHMRFYSPQSGATWAVGPWDYQVSTQRPLPVQGQRRAIVVNDPLTGYRMDRRNVRRRSGDRILVQKYLRSIFDPTRWDVIVFKFPGIPQQNFIKRLIGLPDEQLALVDGDVFTRPASSEDEDGAWAGDTWHIQRKPARVQRGMWQLVFDSQYAPLDDHREGRRWFTSPWTGEGWEIEGRRSYHQPGSGSAVLRWDEQAWPIADRYPYNQTRPPDRRRIGPLPVGGQAHVFPVSDLSVSCGIEPEGPGLAASAVIEARGCEFRADIDGTTATVRYRFMGDECGEDMAWRVLDVGTLAHPLEKGRVTNFEFWHVDQTLYLWVDDQLVAGGPEKGAYDWIPAERIRHALGLSLDRIEQIGLESGDNVLADGLFSGRCRYKVPRPRWEFSGAPLTLHRVAVSRDVHYQATTYPSGTTPNGKTHSRGGLPAGATHPDSTVTLGPDQFFVCGDNSPSSSDARLWDAPDPWVADQIDPTTGVVPRPLLIGKAFFVYFPSIQFRYGIPIPDFGRMRFLK